MDREKERMKEKALHKENKEQKLLPGEKERKVRRKIDSYIYVHCGEPEISLHSHHVSLVQWITRLLPVMRDPGSIPRGVLCETGILLLALSHYIGDPDVIDHVASAEAGFVPHRH